jgi:hypothetical protein
MAGAVVCTDVTRRTFAAGLRLREQASREPCRALATGWLHRRHM